jgi:hypothetical protein
MIGSCAANAGNAFRPTSRGSSLQINGARAGSASFGSQVAALPTRHSRNQERRKETNDRGENFTEEKIIMKAIVVTDQAAGTAGMTLVERPEPEAAINDVVVQVHASGFVGTELTWPSTWTDRLDRDRTPSIPGHELAGVVTALGYGTTGLSVGQRVFGLTDWTRDGTLAEYAAVEARNLAPLPRKTVIRVRP